MSDTVPPFEALRIVGGVGTGKTQRLVARAGNLLEAGAKAESLLVLCATPQSARFFAERLLQYTDGRSGRTSVTTPRALALDVLKSDQAIAWSGREPRLLSAFEELFLLEDMKVSGLRPRRLREMVKFFYRSWTELADDEPTWLLPGEEADVHALLKANLAFLRGIVEPEAANLAVNYLRSLGGALTVPAYAHVLVDDYLSLSRASQTLAGLVATRSIAVSGDPASCIEVFDSYPFEGGLEEFGKDYPNALCETLTVCYRSQAAARAAQKLLSDPCRGEAVPEADPSAPSGKPLVLESTDPADEFACIADTVADALAGGTSARDITVAVPNGTWSRNIVAILRNRGLPACALPAVQPLREDIRDNALCIPARIMTALTLAANPDDAVAWRCWCGFGDYLVNSAAISALRQLATERGIGLAEALEAVSQESVIGKDGGSNHTEGMQRIVSAYQTGKALIEGVKGIRGSKLLDELTRIVAGGTETTAPSIIADLCLAQDGGAESDNSAAMVRRGWERLLTPTLEDQEAVAVVPYRHLCGFSPDTLVIAGFVNGFIPNRDYFDATVTSHDKQAKMHESDTRCVYNMVGKAGKTLVLSYFTSTDLESAGKLKLKISRIRLEEGIRKCAIAPSDFLAYVTQEA